MSVSMDREKKRLAVIWFVGFAFLFCLVFVQSVRGVYGDQWEKPWAWLLPSVMPTLSLILGVLVSDLTQQNRQDIQVDSFVPRMAAAFSIVYLLIVSLTILLQPFSRYSPLTLMNMSHLWLAPLQGLVSAVLGALFVRQK
jgi:hypothetical protein